MGAEPPGIEVLQGYVRAGRAWVTERLGGWAVAGSHPALTLKTFLDVRWNGPYYPRCGFRLLAAHEITPGLRALREHEAARGLDRWPLGCLRRDLCEGVR